MKFARILFMMAIVFCVACNVQNKDEKHKEIVELNNRAFDIWVNNPGNGDSTLKALLLLDEAVEIDSSYYMTYFNKAKILCSIDKPNEAIDNIDKTLILKKDFAEGMMFKALFLLEIPCLPVAWICGSRLTCFYFFIETY